MTARQVVAQVRKLGASLRFDPAAPSGFVLRGSKRVPPELLRAIRAQAARICVEVWLDDEDARFAARLHDFGGQISLSLESSQA